MKNFIIASVLGMSAVTAHAAESGAYVFGNLGYNTEKVKSQEGITDNKAAGGSWEVGAGYRFGSYFATELSYIDLGKMQYAAGDEDEKANFSVPMRAERLALVGILPVSDDVEVFGKVSLNNVHTTLKGEAGGESGSESKSKVMPGIGIGASYAITKNVALRGEYEYIKSAMNSVAGESVASGTNLFKVGVSYKF
ncbi:porin family protein [Chromobacterium vaccinii]|uniref:porin family protein n=1 Tax=Chromobacterium vaccinii TaxID=1108595 RepID=UPI000A41F786|nr:outer membrane beta-barrel protein [Chromobacterium vaccinii]